MKVKNDHRSKFSNLRDWKEEAWKNQGFNGIWTRDLRDTGAMLYQMSYEATHWERGQLIEFISSREEWNDMKHIWNNSYLNCSCRWNRRMMNDTAQVTRRENEPILNTSLNTNTTENPRDYMYGFQTHSIQIYAKLRIAHIMLYGWTIMTSSHLVLHLFLPIAIEGCSVIDAEIDFEEILLKGNS